MILRMYLPGGRIYAGGGGATIPWPPEPARLFAALVHAWGASGRDPDEERLLRELEGLPPPAIHAPRLGEVVRYDAFVPPNELARGKFVRDRQRKTRVVAPILGEPVVHFYLADLPPHRLPLLDGLLARVSRFGSSWNPILLERVPEGPEPNYRPADEASGGEAVWLRVFYPGFLDDLEWRFRALHRERDIAAWFLPYHHLHTSDDPAFFRLDPAFRIALRPGLPLEYWPLLAEELRGLLLREAREALGLPDEDLRWLHGHPAEGEAPPPHVALAPLAFVDGPWADGRVLGVAFLLPRGLKGKERGQLAFLWRLVSREHPFGPWRVRLTPAAGEEKSLQPERWTQKSCRWASVTPVVWDRHPKPGKEAEVVRRMAEAAGLPTPAAHRAVPHSPLKGVRPAREFLLNGRFRGLVTHMVLEFSEPIPGPLLLGRGRYFGMGFFAPLLPGEGGTRAW